VKIADKKRDKERMNLRPTAAACRRPPIQNDSGLPQGPAGPAVLG
jgi:hypothetical protein